MRKRLFVILAAFTAAVSLLLLFFPHGNEIGLSGLELHPGGIPLAETTGDSSLLEAVSLSTQGYMSGIGTITVKLRVKGPEHGVLFGTDMYTDGQGTESDMPGAVIEKYDGGEWQFYANGRYFSPIFQHTPMHFDPGAETDQEISFDSGLGAGRYRVTLFFREITETRYTYNNYRITTAPELSSVGFTFELPETPKTGKPYELRRAELKKLDAEDAADAVVNCITLTAADGNVKFPLYLSKSSVELYENSGGRLKKVGDCSDGRVIPTIRRGYECAEDGFYVGDLYRSITMNYGGFALYGTDYGKKYALKMTFAENEDGTGEQYSLVLNLVFDE